MCRVIGRMLQLWCLTHFASISGSVINHATLCRQYCYHTECLCGCINLPRKLCVCTQSPLLPPCTRLFSSMSTTMISQTTRRTSSAFAMLVVCARWRLYFSIKSHNPKLFDVYAQLSAPPPLVCVCTKDTCVRVFCIHLRFSFNACRRLPCRSAAVSRSGWSWNNGTCLVDLQRQRPSYFTRMPGHMEHHA